MCNEPVMIPRLCPKVCNEPVMIPRLCPKVGNESDIIPQYCSKVGNAPDIIAQYCPKVCNESDMIPQYCPKVCNEPASFVNSRGAGSFFRLHNYFVYLPVYLTRGSSFYTFTFLFYIIKKQKETGRTEVFNSVLPVFF
ncbi:hypothetical protein [Jeotgalibaca porci]|uniref:hypothetical protein n=1 Tax=Jeotgalibaca porci TaxID=1868793 RepID=UPI0035A01A77